MAGYVARVGEIRMHTNIWPENDKGRKHFEDPDVDGRIVLNWVINLVGGCRLGLFGTW